MSLATQPIIPRTFVLVHGAWHTGAAWQQVRTRLEGLGHRVSTPSLAGRAPGANRADLTLQDHVSALVRVLRAQDLRDVVLVGHSMAGPIIARVAEQAPERIAQVIFHDALVPNDGEALTDVIPGLAEQMVPLAEAEPDFSLPPQWELFQALWADPLAGPSPLAELARARQIFEQELVPEPMAPLFEPITLARFRSLGLPTSFVLCRQDAVFGATFWRDMAARLPGCPIVELDGGHEALYTRPDDLAAALLEASHLAPARAA